ncbi:4547_t:CDS:2, partial [Funneliformis geosporum]
LQMHLSTVCLNSLKTHDFWESTNDPSLEKFLEFRFQKGVLKDKKSEYQHYKSELDTIKSLCRISSATNYTVKLRLAVGKDRALRHQLPCQIAIGSGKRPRSVDEHAVSCWSNAFFNILLHSFYNKLDKKSQLLISFWDLQTKRQTIHMESKILEEKAQLQQARQILDATKDIRKQDHLLRETTANLIEKDLLDESYVKNSGQKRSYEPQETILDFENNPFLDKKNKDEKRELPNYSISSESELGDASGCSDNGTLDNGNEDIKESLEREEDGFMNDHAKLEYKMKFLNMHIDKKWKLPSGDYVEDILYEHAKDLQYEDQLHSFIIDTSNDAIMDLFKDVDHDHIITYNTSPEPELSDELINYLMRYRKFQPNEMRELVNSGINISPYDSKKHFNFHYIHQVFSQLLPRQLNLSEAKAVLVHQDSEKNRERKNPKVRKIMGRKCDGIVRDLGSPEEFAVSEEGRTWTGEDGTKYLSDGSLKMPKIMRDMLFQKIKKHGVSFVKKNQIEIVGLLHS